MKNAEEIIKTIDVKKYYKPSEIAKFGLILDASGKPAMFKVLRMIRNKVLKAQNISSGSIPHYIVLGQDFKDFACERFNINK